MNILAPWSLSSYLPLQGFQPLYRSLGNARNSDLRVFTPKPPGADQIWGLPHAASVWHKFGVATPAWAGSLDARLMFHDFVEAHGRHDLWLQSNLSGDLELHHTAPVTRGDRPFALHCESFDRIFFPFMGKSTGAHEQVRAFYRALFEGPNCRTIISHLPTTLAQISDFFQSGIIDDKLVGMPVGIDAAFINRSIAKPDDTIDFVFLGDSADGMDAFALRGGVSCLKLATELLLERQDVRFWFRSERPSNDDLAMHGVDLDALREHEATHIVWIEHFLPEQMQAALVANAHFLLLPGVRLDTLAIMSGLANGAIPVVTDVVGTDVFVDDGVTGIILKGARALVPAEDDASLAALERCMTAALITVIRSLLTHPERMRDIAEAGRAAARARHDGAAFATRLLDRLRACVEIVPSTPARALPDRRCEGDRWVEDVTPAHFTSPSGLVERVRLPGGTIHQAGRRFIFVPISRRMEFQTNPASWSLLRLAHEECYPPAEAPVPVIAAASLFDCIHRVRVRGLHKPPPRAAATETVFAAPYQPPLAAGPPLSFKERVWLALRPYGFLFGIVRSTYRSLRRIGLVK